MRKLLSVLLVIVMILPMAAVSAPVSAASDFYKEASDALINKYLAESDALIEEIKNAPTTVEVTGTKYYVSSSSGNDSNDGLTPETAWKTIYKVNSMTFKPGDGVFFKRGDTFKFVGSLNGVSGITYSAYGSGAKPVFDCTVDASGADKWVATKYPNVWEYTQTIGGDDRDVGTIIFDGGKAWGVMVTAMKNGFRQYNGPVFNGIDPIYDIKTAAFRGAEDLAGNLEFYHDRTNDVLYLYCKNGNPGEVFTKIELLDDDPGIQLIADKAANNYSHDILIDNIDIYGASYGVAGGDVKNVTVQYCVLRWIGGPVQGSSFSFSGDSVTRYGNAIESFGSSDNFVIRYNYATQVYDCCWTAQSTGGSTINNMQVYKNVAEFANTGTEVWAPDDATITNLQVYDNYDRYIGYGWSHQRPGYGPHGGFFYGAKNSGSTYGGNSIHNNVYLFASGSAQSASAGGVDKMNFNNNVYVMEKSLPLGNLPANPGRGEGQQVKFNYTESDIASAMATGWEPGTVFYYTKDRDTLTMYSKALPKEAVTTFKDVSSGFWGKDAINFAVMKGLFKGVTADEFSPDGKMTRAMLVTVLSRLAGYSGESASTYTDVNQSAWYAAGVAWAEKNDIVNKGGKFRPDDNATREEMADMLYRYAKSLYKEGTLDGSKDFADSASITATYADGVKFCTKNGIIGGYSDNTIKPKNNATRTEVATMIMRLVNYLGKTKANSANVLANEPTAVVLKGNALKSVLDNSLVRATVEADESVKLVPFAATGAPKMSIMHAYNPKIDWFSNPYVVIKFNTNIKKDNVTAILQAPNSGGSYDDTTVSGRGKPANGAILIDLTGYTNNLNKNTYKNTMAIKLQPWGTSSSQELSAENYFTISEVVFFDSLGAAQAYAG